jgi:CBS domain-containing protein
MRSCNDVMTMAPACCLTSDPIERAARIMRDNDVGSVPVVDDTSSKHLVGIITDRDIVIKVLADGQNRDGITIERIMTQNPVTCSPQDDIQNAMDRMSQHRVRRIPVVDEQGRLQGIIAQADLLTRVDRPQKTEKVIERISQPVAH